MFRFSSDHLQGVLHQRSLHKTQINHQTEHIFLVVKSFNLFDNSYMFCIGLFRVKLPEDDLKKIETCQSIII